MKASHTVRRIVLLRPSVKVVPRHFSTTAPTSIRARTYDPIRDPNTLQTHLLLSASARVPLITLWTASWCPSCRTVAPIIRDVIENGGGAANDDSNSGSSSSNVATTETPEVMFAEIEIDSPTGGGEMGGRYAIRSIPTLLAFSRQEAVSETRITDVNLLKDRDFLRTWLVKEAARDRNEGGGGGGGGGAGVKGLFGGLFGGN